MVGLLDIALASEVVEVSGQKVTVFAINARGIVTLLARFPQLRMMMTGKEVSPEEWVKVAPDGVSAIIAAGIGMAGDPEQEARADKLPLEDQLSLIGAIWTLTLPKGVGPFVEQLERMGLIAGGAFGKMPDTTSQQPLKS